MDAGSKRSRGGYTSLAVATAAADLEKNNSRPCSWRRWMTPAACFVLVSLSLLLLGRAFGRPPAEWVPAFGARGRSRGPSKEQLLGGLLSPDFADGKSCLSRYQSASYRKPSLYLPSPYLLQRLRSYEALHRRCAPGTTAYRRSVELLRSKTKSGAAAGPPSECNYVVWIPHYGLGNRIVSLVSSFFFALLNERVLLVHVPGEIQGLFCEPFPGTSWVLPPDFPIGNLERFDKDSPESYGNMLRDKVIDNDMRFAANATLPAFAYLHLPWYYNEWDRIFFCEEAQQMLRKIPWLLLKSDHYFIPSLYLVKEYEAELRLLFPERTTVFHHLVRYLIHPSNAVWSYVTRYYDDHLADADERIGIQVRNIKHEPIPFDFLLGQIVNCSINEGILPSIDDDATTQKNEEDKKKKKTAMTAGKSKVVLMTSLDSGYFERVRDMYSGGRTRTGEVVRVYQASHEAEQRTGERAHNAQALAEMVLLSLTDGALVTSACSTFGYVAQGLRGAAPLVLLKPWKSNGHLCRWTESPEPCFLIPPVNVCNKRSGFNEEMAAHVRQCEDEIGGIKLFV